MGIMETIKITQEGCRYPFGMVIYCEMWEAQKMVHKEKIAEYDNFDYFDDYDDSNDEPDEEEDILIKFKKVGVVY